MSSRSTATINVPLTSYAQGIMQDRLSAFRLANLICPIVQVTAATGTFKVFDDRNDFLVESFERGIGGQRKRLGFDATDAEYACKPFGGEIAVDDFEMDLAGNQGQISAELTAQGKLRSLLARKATSYAKRVTDFAFGNLTPVADRGNFTNGDIDPIDQIDEQLESIALQASTTDNMTLVLSLSVWNKIRRNAQVKKRCGGVQVSSISREQLVAALSVPVQLEISAVSATVTKRGQAAAAVEKTSIFGNYAMLLHSVPGATIYDASPFKCFSTSSVLVDAVKTYRDESSASDIHAMDWSEDIKKTGTCARLLAVT